MIDIKELFSGQKKLVGLDIGSSSLKLAEMQQTPKGSILKRFAFMRSFDSAIYRLLRAGRYLDEISAQRRLWDLTKVLRSYEYEQLERSDHEKDFSHIRELRESRKQRRQRRKRAREGSSSSRS